MVDTGFAIQKYNDPHHSLGAGITGFDPGKGREVAVGSVPAVVKKNLLTQMVTVSVVSVMPALRLPVWLGSTVAQIPDGDGIRGSKTNALRGTWFG